MPSTLLPDTNIFLHCQPIHDIDWPTVGGAKPVKLVVCLQVVDELDSHVHDAKLSGRAKRAHDDIEKATANGVRLDVTLDYFNPTADPLPPTMDAAKFDNRIVYSAALYQQLHPGEDVAIVTRDKGMAMRCQTYGVRCIKLDPKYHLDPPADEKDKKLKQAQAELAQFKSRLPKLRLAVFPVGEISLDGKPARLSPSDQFRPLDPGKVMQKARQDYPELNDGTKESIFRPDTDRFIVDEIRSYNLRVGEYRAAVADYVVRYNEWLAGRGPLIRFDLYLFNDGNSPANDIEVNLIFPETVKTVFAHGEDDETGDEADDAPPEPPPAPEPPKPLWSAKGGTSEAVRSLLGLDPELLPGRPFAAELSKFEPYFPALERMESVDIWAPHLTIHDLRQVGSPGMVVQIDLKTLMHTKFEKLGSLSLRFNDAASAGKFAADFNLLATELPARWTSP